MSIKIAECRIAVKNFVAPTNYGRKLRTRWEVRVEGEKRWRKLWLVQMSNAGSFYIVRNNQTVMVDADELIRAAQ